MPQPVLYIAITSHGFGHAVRTAAVAARIQKLLPDINLILATTAPEWLLSSYIDEDFEYRPRVFDVGVIQNDSLTMNKEATREKMQQIRQEQAAIIREEVEFIHQQGVGLILADIPPLAASIADAADIPCWMMSNFAWDFVYRHWGEPFAEIVSWIEDCYQKCDRLFRLPLCEPMSVFPKITDVGLTGGTPRYSVEELRDRFAIKAPKEKTILLTFGGLGLQAIPYQNLEYFPDWQFITFDPNAPSLPNLCQITDKYYRPVDFMPLCGRLVSKPGFSTFSEALILDVPIVSLLREDFAEARVLLEGIQNYADHQIITANDFFQGNWEFLQQTMTPPRQTSNLAKDGTETIAIEVINYLTSSKP
jgi:hypothetical protein